MSAQTSPYEFGTLVWYKAADRVWWPGKIVDPKQTPEEFQEFVNSKKNPINVVFFEREKYYDVIMNSNKVCLYSCPKKMEFIEKGYNLYEKQMNKNNKKPYFDMSTFLTDVIQFEKKIGGDENIFKQFENSDIRYMKAKDLIKDLFVIAKPDRRSSSGLVKTPLTSKSNTPSSKSNTPSTSKSNTPLTSKPNTPSTSKSNTPSTSKSNTPSTSKILINKHSFPQVDSEATRFTCLIVDECNYKTNDYQCLKLHMKGHYKDRSFEKKQPNTKDNTVHHNENNIQEESAGEQLDDESDGKVKFRVVEMEISTTTYNLRNKIVDNNESNMFLGNPEESVKDKNDDEDKVEAVRMEVTETASNLKNDTDDQIESNMLLENAEEFIENRNDGEDLDEAIIMNFATIVASNLKNNNVDQIESNMLLENAEEFVENRNDGEDQDGAVRMDVTTIESNVKHDTVDQIENNMLLENAEEFVENRNDGEDQNGAVIMDVTTIVASNLKNNNVDQIESNMLLENAEEFAENRNDGEDQDGAVKMDVTTIESNVKYDTVDQIESNMLLENGEEFVENRNDGEDQDGAVKMDVTTIASNLKNDTVDQIESNMLLENADEFVDDKINVYSSNVNTKQIQDKIAVDSMEEDRFECLLDSLSTPDWAKENSWETLPENGLKEAKLFTTIDKKKKLILDLPPMETTPFEFKTTYMDNIESDEVVEYHLVRAPKKPAKQKNEDFEKLKNVQLLINAMKSNPSSVSFKINNGVIIKPKK